MKTRSMLFKSLLLAIVAGVWTGCTTPRSSDEGSHPPRAGSPQTVSAPPTQAEQEAMTPAEALARLKAGNQRFVTGNTIARNLTAERIATAGGQYPFAVMLSCIDSRAPGELIFDQGLGDIFNVRVAGNVLNNDILGSMEFACKVAGAKLIAVVGHTSCGAVKGATSGAELGHLTGLLAKIKPAAAAVPIAHGETNVAHVDLVAAENVKRIKEEIIASSPVLADMVREGKIVVVGGIHELSSGQVTFFP